MRSVYSYKYNAIRFEMEEYKTKITVQYFNKYLCERNVGKSQPFMLRNAEFGISRVKLTQMQKTLFHKSLQLYNSLPTNIKNELNENIFKKYI